MDKSGKYMQVFLVSRTGKYSLTIDGQVHVGTGRKTVLCSTGVIVVEVSVQVLAVF